MPRYIDGNALKEAFYQKMKELLKSTDTPQISNEALSLLCGASLIIDAPTVDVVERKRGRWRHYEGEYFCDQCNAELDDMSPFCPICGADMRENGK